MCPSKVSEFDVTGVNESTTVEVVAVIVPVSEPVKCNVPESCVALSVIFKARSYVALLKLMGAVEWARLVSLDRDVRAAGLWSAIIGYSHGGTAVRGSIDGDAGNLEGRSIGPIQVICPNLASGDYYQHKQSR